MPGVPREDSADLIEEGRRLFAQPCVFFAGAGKFAALPPTDLPEVAFAGRSNVGKSSLINALTRRSRLARVSNTPGRTQEINFFRLGDRLTLVDLPGYGYARASRTRSAAWNRLVVDFVRDRATLRGICLLVDSRRGLNRSDEAALEVLSGAAVSFQIVLTKCDKAAHSPAEVARQVPGHPEIIATSAKSGQGIPALRGRLAALATPR